MEQTIQIRCKNNKNILNVSIGSTLSEIFSLSGLQMQYGPICARVNNKIEGLHFRVYKPKEVEFLDMNEPSSMRAYTRSLFFVLNKAAHDLYPDCTVIIDIPVSNGYYVDLRLDRPVTVADVDAVRERMKEIIAAAHPIHRHEVTTEEAIEMLEVKVFLQGTAAGRYGQPLYHLLRHRRLCGLLLWQYADEHVTTLSLRTGTLL